MPPQPQPSPIAPSDRPEPSQPPPKPRGGRPRSDPESVRTATIGVRVSPAEYALLRLKSEHMAMTPAQWLREAALTRRLPTPPVAAINREYYAELGRLAGNLNQLTRLANEGRPVHIADALLTRLSAEVRALRLALIGATIEVQPVTPTPTPVQILPSQILPNPTPP